MINAPDIKPCATHGPFNDWEPGLRKQGVIKCLVCGALVPRSSK